MGQVPSSGAQVLASLVAFGFSFLILITIWTRFTEIANSVPVETKTMLRLNFLLLFLVAIEPYLFFLLMQGLTNPTSSSVLTPDVSAYYAVDLGAMNLVLGYFAHLLTKGGLVPPEKTGHFRQRRNSLIFVGATFLISTPPIFWTLNIAGEPLRIILWILTFGIARVSFYTGDKNTKTASA